VSEHERPGTTDTVRAGVIVQMFVDADSERSQKPVAEQSE
jgi:hypothetical protein